MHKSGTAFEPSSHRWIIFLKILLFLIVITNAAMLVLHDC